MTDVVWLTGAHPWDGDSVAGIFFQTQAQTETQTPAQARGWRMPGRPRRRPRLVNPESHLFITEAWLRMLWPAAAGPVGRRVWDAAIGDEARRKQSTAHGTAVQASRPATGPSLAHPA